MKRRTGFTLIEMLCVIALLGVLGFGLAMLFRNVIVVERTQAHGFDRVLQSNALADQFRSDVARSQSAPDHWRDFKADASTLILEPAAGECIVYEWQDGQLRRLTFATNLDRPTTDRTLPTAGSNVEFIRDSKLIRLRLHTLQAGQPAAGQSLEIAAALAGDRR